MRVPEGVRVIHQRSCATRRGAKRCTCTAPTYQATVGLGERGKRTSRNFHDVTAAAEWRTSQLRQTSPAAAQRTIERACDSYLARMASGEARTRSGDEFLPSTAKGYHQVIRHTIIPKLGTVLVSELTPRHGRKLVADLLAAGKSPQTIRNTIQALRSVLADLRRRDEYVGDPLAGVVLPTSRGTRDRFAGASELAQLVAATPDRDRLAWMLAGYAGLRLSEIRALEWSSVDTERGELHVVAAQPMQAPAPHRPKSRAGRRVVPLPRVLREALAAARPESGVGLVAEIPDARRFQQRADRAWKEAGLTRITPHEARHTYASLMADAGVPIGDLSEFLGHSTIQLTMKRYRHLYPEARTRASAAMDRLLDA